MNPREGGERPKPVTFADIPTYKIRDWVRLCFGNVHLHVGDLISDGAPEDSIFSIIRSVHESGISGSVREIPEAFFLRKVAGDLGLGLAKDNQEQAIELKAKIINHLNQDPKSFTFFPIEAEQQRLAQSTPLELSEAILAQPDFAGRFLHELWRADRKEDIYKAIDSIPGEAVQYIFTDLYNDVCLSILKLCSEGISLEAGEKYAAEIWTLVIRARNHTPFIINLGPNNQQTVSTLTNSTMQNVRDSMSQFSSKDREKDVRPVSSFTFFPFEQQQEEIRQSSPLDLARSILESEDQTARIFHELWRNNRQKDIYSVVGSIYRAFSPERFPYFILDFTEDLASITVMISVDENGGTIETGERFVKDIWTIFTKVRNRIPFEKELSGKEEIVTEQLISLTMKSVRDIMDAFK